MLRLFKLAIKLTTGSTEPVTLDTAVPYVHSEPNYVPAPLVSKPPVPVDDWKARVMLKLGFEPTWFEYRNLGFDVPAERWWKRPN